MLLALGGQREQLSDARDKARSLRGVTTETRAELKRLTRRRLLKRGLLWCVIAAQTATIFALLYRMWTNGGRLRQAAGPRR